MKRPATVDEAVALAEAGRRVRPWRRAEATSLYLCPRDPGHGYLYLLPSGNYHCPHRGCAEHSIFAPREAER